MDFWPSLLTDLRWFFGFPPVNQVLGALIAAGFGLGAFFVQTRHRERIENRRIARAVLQEMLQTGNFLLASMKTLIEKGPAPDGLRRPHIVKMRPPQRKIVAVLGSAIGALSDQAAANVVAFDGTLQALEREFEEYIDGLVDNSTYLNPESCSNLAERVKGALKLLSGNIQSVIDDAYGPSGPIPESTRKMIGKIQSS